jgi:hypothetical protein
MRILFAILLLSTLSSAIAFASGRAALQRTVPAALVDASSKPSSSPPIVIGFVGGFLNHDAAIHGGVKLAAHLRQEYPSGVYIRVFENRRGEDAHRVILRLLDADHDGSLSPAEKQTARIILYGHSWGGSETVNLARELQKDGIPVLLTVQVDSVRKPGEDDSVIPSNVAEAANFYQSSGWVHGVSQVRAADPARTRIIGNFKFDYAQHPIACPGYPWYAQLFEKPHIEIECDPAVSNQVEALIRSQLSPAFNPDSR